MTETTTTARDLFALEIYRSISGFKDSVAIYRNLIALLERKGAGNLEEPEKLHLNQAIANMRYFELHAYINLKSLQEGSGLELKKIEELRSAIDTQVPTREQMSALAIEYSKLLGSKFAEALLKTNAEQIGQFTGSAGVANESRT